MVDDKKRDLEREAERTERLSRFARCRLMAQELGIQVIAMNFVTGEALVHFKTEQSMLLASMEFTS